MRFAIAIDLGLVAMTAVAGTALAISGEPEAGWLVWIVGSIVSGSAMFLTPWLSHFFTSGSGPLSE